MDIFDIKILAALQADGRLTNNELAEQVGLSASQCSRRRAALEAAGVVASYHAHLSAAAIGLGVAAYIEVKLTTHSPANSADFRRLLAGLPEVQDASAVTGDADYLLKLVVPDLKELSRILNDVFLAHAAVQHVRSSIVLDQLKQTSQLPLRQLGG